MQIVDQHTPRKFSAVVHDRGIVLCTEDEGAFLCLRFPVEVDRLLQLLHQLDVQRLEDRKE